MDKEQLLPSTRDINDQENASLKRLFYIDFIAGCIGGATGTCVGHPFDTVKVRLQTQKADVGKKAGAIKCAVNAMETEGVTAVFKGLTAPLLGLAGINAILFGVHGNVMKHLQPGAKSQAVAGLVAGACQTWIICPVELAKTILQLQGQGMRLTKDEKRFKGPLDCLLKLYNKRGFFGCYRGFVATMIRDIPGFALYFWLYHILCHEFTGGNNGPFLLMIFGGLTGMISWAATYPIDVIKTRIQAESIISGKKYTGIIDCFNRSIAQDGWRVLYKGLSVCMVRAFPVNAATFGGVEISLKIMDSFRHEEPHKPLLLESP